MWKKTIIYRRSREIQKPQVSCVCRGKLSHEPRLVDECRGMIDNLEKFCMKDPLSGIRLIDGATKEAYCSATHCEYPEIFNLEKLVLKTPFLGIRLIEFTDERELFLVLKG